MPYEGARMPFAGRCRYSIGPGCGLMVLRTSRDVMGVERMGLGAPDDCPTAEGNGHDRRKVAPGDRRPDGWEAGDRLDLREEARRRSCTG